MLAQTLLLTTLITLSTAFPLTNPLNDPFNGHFDLSIDRTNPNIPHPHYLRNSDSTIIRKTDSALTRDTTTSCSPEPLGSGPSITPDTDTTFWANTDISTTASTALQPSNCFSPSFTNRQGLPSQRSKQLGSFDLATYDPKLCMALCETKEGCRAFNIFYERDPVLTPGDGCANPASTTSIKCATYGDAISVSAEAERTGWYRGPPDAKGDAFHVVVGGSNGYNYIC